MGYQGLTVYCVFHFFLYPIIKKLAEGKKSITLSNTPDKRGIEDNSKIIFLIYQQKHIL